MQGRMVTKKSLLQATSFHETIKALQPETKIESLNVECVNLHPPNQLNPIKSISGALNPSPRKLGNLQPHFVQRKTRAVAPNQGHQGHCSREPHTSHHASQSNSATVPSHLRPSLQARSREHISWSVHTMVGCDLTPQKNNGTKNSESLKNNQCGPCGLEEKVVHPSSRVGKPTGDFRTPIAATGCRVHSAQRQAR